MSAEDIGQRSTYIYTDHINVLASNCNVCPACTLTQYIRVDVHKAWHCGVTRNGFDFAA